MTDALEDHIGTVSIRGRTITNLRFADDTDGLAGDEQELADLVSRLDNTPASYGMEISAKKNQANDQQHQWHQQEDHSEWTKIRNSVQVQVPGFSYHG